MVPEPGFEACKSLCSQQESFKAGIRCSWRASTFTRVPAQCDAPFTMRSAWQSMSTAQPLKVHWVPKVKSPALKEEQVQCVQLSMPCCISVCACFAAVHSLSAVAATPQGRPCSPRHPLLALASVYAFCSPCSCCCPFRDSATLMRRRLQRSFRLSLSCCTTSSTTVAAAHSSAAHAHRAGPALPMSAVCMSQQGMRFGSECTC